MRKNPILAISLVTMFAMASLFVAEGEAHANEEIFPCYNPDPALTARALLYSNTAQTHVEGVSLPVFECAERMTRAQYRNAAGNLVWTGWQAAGDPGYPGGAVVTAGIHTNSQNDQFIRSDHCARPHPTDPWHCVHLSR